MRTEEDELFGPETEVAETLPEPVAEPVVQSVPVVEPAPAAEVEPQPRENDGRFAPIAALQEERQKRQDAERRVSELEGRQQPAPQPQAIDPLDDPDGFNRNIEARIQATAAEQRFAMSERFSRKDHGDEAVDKAVSWATQRASTDPVFAASYMRDPDPIGYIVRQHQQADRLALLETDEVAFARSIMERHGLTVATATPAPAPVPAQPTPRSIASAPSSGGQAEVAMGTQATVDAAFKD